MQVETIYHISGYELPILLDDSGLPIPAPNEFILGRRSLSTNTLKRNLVELAIFYKWLKLHNIDPLIRIQNANSFKEAEIKGSLIEFLRREHTGRKVQKLVVSVLTFNQRLTTVRQFLGWLYEVELGKMPHSDKRYELLREQKARVLKWLDSSFVNAPPKNKRSQKGLTDNQAKYLLEIINPKGSVLFGRDSAVRFRNYVSIVIMMNYGLRPGELLSLRVEDIEFGGISAIKVIRRPIDPSDKRKPRPKIKRNGRVLVINDHEFGRVLDEYIMKWREELEEKSRYQSEYLILNDEGLPLSLSSIRQLFQIIREKYPNELPDNLSAKSLRHTFSTNIEKQLKALGIEENKRAETLAYLRGDNSLTSQLVYLEEEIIEQASIALKKYHEKLLNAKN